jgi:hypothetical protein
MTRRKLTPKPTYHQCGVFLRTAALMRSVTVAEVWPGAMIGCRDVCPDATTGFSPVPV